MKEKVMRRTSAVLVAAALLFSTLFTMSVSVKAASFTPRLTSPASSNKYYYDSNYNVFQKYGYGMPNCTAYAYGRAYEILGTEPKLSWNGAGQWYGYNQSNGYYKYGKTPKVGAIACWSYSGGGHVAVVEQIDSNGNMTLSNSEWGGRTFYLTTAKTTDSNPGGNSWWTFQGYIYLIDSAETQTYKAGVYKTNAEPWLNMRSTASTSASTVAQILKGVQLSVTKVTSAGGYNWGYTTYNGKTGWVALDFCDYVSELPAETTAPTKAPETTAAPTTEPEEIIEEYTRLPAADKHITSDIDYSYGAGVGDVNADGLVNVNDVSLIQSQLAGLVCLNDRQLSWCDINGDGAVTVADVTLMQNQLAEVN